jgi:hypothetical protein
MDGFLKKGAMIMLISFPTPNITLNVIQPQPSANLFQVTVIDVKNNVAIVSSANGLLEARSEVPLRPGMSFHVRQVQEQDGSYKWRVLDALDESGKAIPTAEKEIDIMSALRLSDLPATNDSAARIMHLLQNLNVTSLLDFLTAITSMKAGIESPELMQAVMAFLSSALASEAAQASGSDKGAAALRQNVLTPAQLAVTGLQELAQMLVSNKTSPLDNLLHTFFNQSSEAVRQALGGQVQSWLEGAKDKPFFYIPLFAFLKQSQLHSSEIYIYPPIQGLPDEQDSKEWRFVLTLETDALGWMQVDTLLTGRQLRLQVLVEQAKTKQLFDENMSTLSAMLFPLQLQLDWSGCRVGQVKSHLRQIQQTNNRFADYEPVNLLI